MKTYSLLAAIAAVVVTGCGHKDAIVVNGADGSKVTLDTGPSGSTTINGVGADGSKVTETITNSGVNLDAKGKDGSAATMTSNANGMTIQGTDKNGNKVNETINANGMSASDGKGGSTNLGAGVVKESDLGLPFYPGSVEGKATIMSGITEDAKAKTVISTRTSSDDPSKVVQFYEDKIKGGQTGFSGGGGTATASITGKLSSGAEASVTAINDGKTGTTIMISVKANKS